MKRQIRINESKNTERHIVRYTKGQTPRSTEFFSDRPTDRQTDRQTYRQADRQKDRQTDTDRQADRQTETARSYKKLPAQDTVRHTVRRLLLQKKDNS